MKEIEQRAEDFASVYSKSEQHFAEECYIQGATEQQEIVIKRACEWLKANSYSFRSDEFLEPLIDAMKGE